MTQRSAPGEPYIGPAVVDAPVTPAAVRALLQGLPDLERVTRLVAPETAAAHANRFKLDRSFATGGGGRVSVNDTGEPQAFRARLQSARWLGLDPTAFLDLAAAGSVQTTASLKWSGARLDRVGLYFEELGARGPDLRRAVHALYGAPLPTPPWNDAELAAICVDFRGPRPVCIKEYWASQDPAQLPLLGDERAFLEAVPPNPRTGGQRFLWGRRTALDGGVQSRKLIWVTEANTRDYADHAWTVRDACAARWDTPHPQLDALRAAWTHDALLYADLVCLNTDPQGAAQGLCTYVSVK